MLENIINKTTLGSSRLKPVRKQSILIDLSSRFASLTRPSSKAVNLFQEQFYTLILNTSSVERKMISQTLAHSQYIPKAIIIFFAMEEISIAQPALLYSPVLKPRDINLILEKCAFTHTKTLARRENLDISNVNGLLKLDNETGEIRNILKTNSILANNPEISKIISHSAVSNDWVSRPAENITIQTSPNIKPTVSSSSKDLSESLLKLANKGGRLHRKPFGKPARSPSAPITLKQLETQLLSYARHKNTEGFAILISNCCGLSSQVTSKFMQQQDAGMLATLLRALEITDVTTARILLLANNNIGRNAQIFKVVMNKYQNLDRAKCIMFYEKLGADFTQPYIINTNKHTTTRYALSLAARDRRTELLKRQNMEAINHDEIRLTA